MIDPRTLVAARSNAHWCEAVCKAHGHPGERNSGLWVNRHQTPPFYPNVVTLSPSLVAAEIHGLLLTLAGSGLGPDWAIKDSFDALDLVPLGFRTLLEGRWIWRDASAPLASSVSGSVQFTRVRDEAALTAWEDAWGSALGHPPAAWRGPVFAAPLLHDHDVAILAAHRDGSIVAGAVANRSGDVVGLSNLFTHGADAGSLVSSCVAAVVHTFPGLPLAGWEAAPRLALAAGLHFEPIGPLRIWVSPDAEAGRR